MSTIPLTLRYRRVATRLADPGTRFRDSRSQGGMRSGESDSCVATLESVTLAIATSLIGVVGIGPRQRTGWRDQDRARAHRPLRQRRRDETAGTPSRGALLARRAASRRPCWRRADQLRGSRRKRRARRRQHPDRGTISGGPSRPMMPPGSRSSSADVPFEDPHGGPAGLQEQRCRAWARGFVISPDGYIVTNNHVVEDVDKIRCMFPTATSSTAEVVGRDPKTDIALIKVDAGQEQLAALPLGDSDDAACRRLGRRDRQSLRPRAHRDRRHRQRRSTATSATGRLRRLHPDRRRDQPRQLGRPAARPRRAR